MGARLPALRMGMRSLLVWQSKRTRLSRYAVRHRAPRGGVFHGLMCVARLLWQSAAFPCLTSLPQVDGAICALRTSLATSSAVELLVFFVALIATGAPPGGGANRLAWVHLPHILRAYLAIGFARAVPVLDAGAAVGSMREDAVRSYAATLQELWRPGVFLAVWTVLCALLDVICFLVLVFGTAPSAFGLGVCLVMLAVDAHIPLFAASLQFRLPPAMVAAVWSTSRAVVLAPLRVRESATAHPVPEVEATHAAV